MKSIVDVYQGSLPSNFSAQPTVVHGIKYACGCWAFYKHAILAVGEDGTIYTRYIGNQALRYNERRALGNIYCTNGYAYYVNNAGAFVKSKLIDGHEKLMLGQEITISSGYTKGAVVSSNTLMFFDEGGLRLPNGERFYPLTAKTSIDAFSAGIVDDYAFFMQDNGSVLLDHVGSRMRVFYGDLSALIIDSVLPGPLVVARYVRVGNLDDGTVDYAIFPLVGKKLALLPYSVFKTTTEDEGPGFVSIGETSIAVGTFNDVAVGPLPYWLTATPFHKATYVNAIQELSLSAKNGRTQVTLSFLEENVRINEFDKLSIRAWRDDGIQHAIEMVVSSPVTVVSGTSKKILISGETPTSWHLSNTRLPNYVEMSAGKYVIDFAPWEREHLFLAASPVSQTPIDAVIVDFWNAKPFTHDSITGYEITPGRLAPIASANIGLEAAVNLTASGDVIDIEVRGWSSAKAGYNNHNVKLFLRLEDDSLFYVGEGHWKKTWEGTTSGADKISFVLPAGSITGKIKGVCLGMEADANANAVAYPSSVVFLTGMKERPTADYAAPWDNVDDARLQLPSQNLESAMLSVAPYSHEDIVVAATFGIYHGDKPNEHGNTVFGFVFGAKDMRNMNAVLLSKPDNKIRVVKVRNGAKTILYEQNDTSGVLATIESSDIGLILRYFSGKISLYRTNDQLSEFPGTKILEYEWKASDGDFAPQMERHVGVYGLVQTPEVLALAWGSSEGKLIGVASDNLPNAGTIVFLDGSSATYSGVLRNGVPLGPFQVRNITNWPAEYNNPGYAVSISLLDWDAPSSAYEGKILSTGTGYAWTITKADTTPYKIVSGSRQDQHDRIRLYSDTITGKENVGLDTKAYIGGDVLTSVSYSAGAFVAPPERAALETTERVYITRFMAFEEAASSLQDALCLAANIAGVECEALPATSFNQNTEVELP